MGYFIFEWILLTLIPYHISDDIFFSKFFTLAIRKHFCNCNIGCGASAKKLQACTEQIMKLQNRLERGKHCTVYPFYQLLVWCFNIQNSELYCENYSLEIECSSFESCYNASFCIEQAVGWSRSCLIELICLIVFVKFVNSFMHACFKAKNCLSLLIWICHTGQLKRC